MLEVYQKRKAVHQCWVVAGFLKTFLTEERKEQKGAKRSLAPLRQPLHLIT